MTPDVTPVAFMRSLADWPAAQCKAITGVMTDIDDTLTTEGAITPDALQALTRLRAAGLPVIAITGRPVGWSQTFAATWPLNAVVAENGAVALISDAKNAAYGTPDGTGLLSKTYQQDAATRAHNAVRMQAAAALVLREVPGARLATDSAGRETDIAIDHSEFTHLPPDAIANVVALLQAQGMTVTVSSIHINAWFGSHNKLAGARWIVQTLWGRSLDAELGHWVYVGDSTNDQVMFQHFPHSVGVANVQRFAPQLQHKPRYITPSERGAGFAEVVNHLLKAR